MGGILLQDKWAKKQMRKRILCAFLFALITNTPFTYAAGTNIEQIFGRENNAKEEIAQEDTSIWQTEKELLDAVRNESAQIGEYKKESGFKTSTPDRDADFYKKIHRSIPIIIEREYKINPLVKDQLQNKNTPLGMCMSQYDEQIDEILYDIRGGITVSINVFLRNFENIEDIPNLSKLITVEYGSFSDAKWKTENIINACNNTPLLAPFLSIIKNYKQAVEEGAKSRRESIQKAYESILTEKKDKKNKYDACTNSKDYALYIAELDIHRHNQTIINADVETKKIHSANIKGTFGKSLTLQALDLIKTYKSISEAERRKAFAIYKKNGGKSASPSQINPRKNPCVQTY